MKKSMITLGLALVVSSMAYSSASLDINLGNIEKEFKLLEQKEKERFGQEEKKAQISQQRYNNSVMMINTIAKRVESLQMSEKTSFFPQQQKSLLEKYKKLDKDLRISAGNEKKQLEEFNQLKSVLGY